MQLPTDLKSNETILTKAMSLEILSVNWLMQLSRHLNSWEDNQASASLRSIERTCVRLPSRSIQTYTESNLFCVHRRRKQIKVAPNAFDIKLHFHHWKTNDKTGRQLFRLEKRIFTFCRNESLIRRTRKNTTCQMFLFAFDDQRCYAKTATPNSSGRVNEQKFARSTTDGKLSITCFIKQSTNELCLQVFLSTKNLPTSRQSKRWTCFDDRSSSLHWKKEKNAFFLQVNRHRTEKISANTSSLINEKQPIVLLSKIHPDRSESFVQLTKIVKCCHFSNVSPF